MKSTLSKLLRLIALLTQVAVVGGIDYYTGYQVQVGALYAVPVAFATWHFGTFTGVLISGLVTGIGLWAELATGMVYTARWMMYANIASELSIYLFVAFSFSHFQRTIDMARRRVQAFRGRLPVCACCYRVDGGDSFWMDFPTYLRKNSEAEPEFRTCPLCEATGKSGPQPTSSPK